MIRQLLSPSRSCFSFGIICGRIWGSLAVEDHLRSILGIICGLGISCGWGSFAVLYSTDNRKVGTFFASQHVRCRCCYRSYLDRFLILKCFLQPDPETQSTHNQSQENA